MNGSYNLQAIKITEMKKLLLVPIILAFTFFLTSHGYSPQTRQTGWQAGAASIDITPDLPMWMAGYGSRNKPGDEVAHPLYAKALSIKDDNEKTAVIVTIDILGIPKTLRKTIESAVLEKYNIEPAYLMINASHTHGGPEVR